MNTKKIALIVTIALSSVPMAYAHPQIEAWNGGANDTLCRDNEDIYFNAELENGKIVSLCGYQHYSPDTGYVKYRDGDLNKVEQEYPKDNKPPRGRFLIYNARLGPNAQGHEVFFYIGDYRYSLASVAGGCVVFVYDVSSIKRKKIFSKPCTKKTSLKEDGIASSRMNDESIYKKFPEQFQDPNEPEFHKSSWIDDYKSKQ